jgi:hypothetical protein
MACKWAFSQDGVEFRNGSPTPVTLKFVFLKPEEVEEFRRLLEEAGRVYGMLRAARNAFMAGQADYTDAADNAKTLLKELDKAATSAYGVAVNVDAFFDPPEVSKHLEGDDLIAFAAIAADMIAKRGAGK